MAKQKLSPHMLDLAKRGAEAQVRDLVQELKYLLDLFPHLKDSFDKDELPLKFIMAKESGHAVTAGAERSRLSASGRKAGGARTKNYTPAKRKAEK